MNGVVAEKFLELKKRQEVALIIYITFGFPDMKRTMEYIDEIIRGGADIIELGVPFSDPIADGATIQYASQIALNSGACLEKLIEMVGSVKFNIPIVLMSYLNPIISYGRERFFKDVKKAGIGGVIIPDLPIEESKDWTAQAEDNGIETIFLVAPTSTEQRIKEIARSSQGFIYAVSVTGTTGMRQALAPGLFEFIKKVRKNSDKPIAVGFGISNPEQIDILKGEVDGVIVGSRIVEAIKEGENLVQLIKELKEATRRI